MDYIVLIVRSAQRELRDLPTTLRAMVTQRLLALEENPRPRGSIKLRNTDRYRIRIGDYRVLYRIDDQNRRVLVLSIGHRREVYR